MCKRKIDLKLLKKETILVLEDKESSNWWWKTVSQNGQKVANGSWEIEQLWQGVYQCERSTKLRTKPKKRKAPMTSSLLVFGVYRAKVLRLLETYVNSKYGSNK